MELVNSGFHTRKNFLENYLQFEHVPSKRFASPILGWKLKELVWRGAKLLTCRRHQLSWAGPAEECKEHMVWFWIVKNRGILMPWLIHVGKLIWLCHLVCLECTGVWKNVNWSSLSLEELTNTLKHFSYTSWLVCWRLLCGAKWQCVYSTRLLMMDSKPVRNM